MLETNYVNCKKRCTFFKKTIDLSRLLLDIRPSGGDINRLKAALANFINGLLRGHELVSRVELLVRRSKFAQSVFAHMFVGEE